VTWEQEVPTGETEYTRTQEITWKLAVLGGLVAFGAMLGGGWDLGTALGVGVAVGVTIAAADSLRSMKFNIQGVTVGGHEKTEAEREVERRSKVTRIYGRERRWAEVHLEPQSKALFFILMQGVNERTAQVLYEVPLLSFQELKLDTDQEWFGDIGARELANELRVGSAWVIVALAGEHGVLLIARSGRDKASIAHLHQILISDFIGKRRELLARAEELASRPAREGGTA
jgi:hypothetical protein